MSYLVAVKLDLITSCRQQRKTLEFLFIPLFLTAHRLATCHYQLGRLIGSIQHRSPASDLARCATVAGWDI